MLPVRRAPLWFYLSVAIAWIALAAGVSPAFRLPVDAGAHDTRPALAFFGFLIAIVEIAWKGLEVAGRVTLQVLAYSLGLLWKFVNIIADGAHELVVWSWRGLHAGWSLLRTTYTRVLRPALGKLWQWTDRAERWLHDTFGPVLTWLRRIRQWVLDFYVAYVRPVLDLLDVARHALHLLASFGLDWARALDARIASLEARIDRPVRLLVAKINQVVNIVDRIATADGLFQRSAFVRSLARDYRQAWGQLAGGGYFRSLSEARRAELALHSPTTETSTIVDVAGALRRRGVTDAETVDALGAAWRRELRAARGAGVR